MLGRQVGGIFFLNIIFTTTSKPQELITDIQQGRLNQPPFIIHFLGLSTVEDKNNTAVSASKKLTQLVR